MKRETINLAREFLACSDELPDETLPTVIWACENMEFVQSVVGTEPYTETAINQIITESMERKDYVLMFLAVYKKLHDKTTALKQSEKALAISK